MPNRSNDNRGGSEKGRSRQEEEKRSRNSGKSGSDSRGSQQGSPVGASQQIKKPVSEFLARAGKGSGGNKE